MVRNTSCGWLMMPLTLCSTSKLPRAYSFMNKIRVSISLPTFAPIPIKIGYFTHIKERSGSFVVTLSWVQLWWSQSIGLSRLRKQQIELQLFNFNLKRLRTTFPRLLVLGDVHCSLSYSSVCLPPCRYNEGKHKYGNELMKTLKQKY